MNALICRIVNRAEWQRVSNPLWLSPHSEWFAAKILESNRFVPYVQYENSGVQYRVVRVKDLSQYGLEHE